MIVCPSCGAENTEGADSCDDCQASLTEVQARPASTSIESSLLEDPIERLQPKTPQTVGPDDKVGDVLKKLVDESIGCVMVVDNGRLVGIFSERDALIRINVDAQRMADRPIKSVMTANPTTLRSQDTIAFALHRMDLGGYRHIPILQDGKLTGVISIRDILGYLTQQTAPA